MARRVVVASPQGGTGRTTLVAQLAAALTAMGKRCLAVDLDPQNTLALLLSQSASAWVANGAGVRGNLTVLDRELSPSLLAESLRSRRAQVAHIPFGARDLVRRRELRAELSARPEALDERLTALTPASCEVVLIDTPGGENPWTEAALAAADQVLVPLRADPICLASLSNYESYLKAVAPHVFPHALDYVLNLFDPSRQLASDIADVIAECAQGRVLPRVVHEDEALREQLALGAPLALEAASQAYQDFAWLASFLARGLERSDASAAAAHAS